MEEGKVCDRYLAPAISEFVTNTLKKTDIGTEIGQQTSDGWQELVSLHRRWGKVNKRTEGDNLRAQACRDADASRRFTRIVQRKNLPWEKDSFARAAYDPAHIPDCNVQATVGHHFIFSEPIPRVENGQGYLRGKLHSSPPSGHPRDSPRVWRQGINLRSTALRGTPSEPCGKRRR